MKKVLIFYASYGGGHLSAARSIKEYIEQHYEDIEINLVDCVKYVNKALEKLTTKAYNEMAKNIPWVWGKIYSNSQKGIFAKISNSSNKIMALKLNKLLQEYNLPTVDILKVGHHGSKYSSSLEFISKISPSFCLISAGQNNRYGHPHKEALENLQFCDTYITSIDGAIKIKVGKSMRVTKVR